MVTLNSDTNILKIDFNILRVDLFILKTESEQLSNECNLKINILYVVKIRLHIKAKELNLKHSACVANRSVQRCTTLTIILSYI